MQIMLFSCSCINICAISLTHVLTSNVEIPTEPSTRSICTLNDGFNCKLLPKNRCDQKWLYGHPIPNSDCGSREESTRLLAYILWLTSDRNKIGFDSKSKHSVSPFPPPPSLLPSANKLYIWGHTISSVALLWAATTHCVRGLDSRNYLHTSLIC